MGNRPNQHGRRDFAFSSDPKWIIGGFFRRFFCNVRSRAPTEATRSRNSRGEVTKQYSSSRGNRRKTETRVPSPARPVVQSQQIVTENDVFTASSRTMCGLIDPSQNRYFARCNLVDKKSTPNADYLDASAQVPIKLIISITSDRKLDM